MKWVLGVIKAIAAIGTITALGWFAPEDRPDAANALKVNYAQYDRIQSNMYVSGPNGTGRQ